MVLIPIPPHPGRCSCGGELETARTPDEAHCVDCGARWAYDQRYGWIRPGFIPASADVWQLMNREGLSQDEAVRQLGGIP